jgi:hypothetical protein
LNRLILRNDWRRRLRTGGSFQKQQASQACEPGQNNDADYFRSHTKIFNRPAQKKSKTASSRFGFF